MPNRLAGETSPYLLQHKDNPVDWHPWGEEALTRARERDMPLLVSIGYSACHWCHVMERESFEDPEIAALMNERFVPIKVDREERPDIDALCMEACQAMTGQGGWPLNAFLTPDQAPFYAGTYFPPEPRHGLPSWRMVLLGVADAWANRREEIVEQGDRLVQSLGATARIEPSAEPIRPELLDQALENLRATYDRAHGGWGGAPKFPAASTIELLLARGEREMSLGTLRGDGPRRDLRPGRRRLRALRRRRHLDRAALREDALRQRAAGARVPARLAGLRRGALAARVLRDARLGAARDARARGRASARHSTRTPKASKASSMCGPCRTCATCSGTRWLRPRSRTSARASTATSSTGANVLEARGPEPDALAEIRSRLLEARSARVRPGLDDKRLTSWNALMISALAEAGAVLGRQDYVDAAVACASFVLSELRDATGGCCAPGRTAADALGAYLEDHGYLLEALITLYETTFDPRWYHEAVALADTIIERFSDSERGGFFTTPIDHERLAARRKDLEDSPIPSGNSAAAFGLLRLALLSGEGRYERHALGVLRLLFALAVRHPHAFGHLLSAADFYLAPVREVAIVGPEAGPLLDVVRGEFRPHIVLAGGEADGVPLLEGREPVDGRAAAYVCEHFVCKAPVTTPEELAAAL